MMKIYAYYVASAPERIKIGQTGRDDVMKRIREQITGQAEEPILMLDQEVGFAADGRQITDRMVHAALEAYGVRRVRGEWFECDVDTVRDAIHSLTTGGPMESGRNQTFGMRPEQEAAVHLTHDYFMRHADRPGRERRFLWNAKMRFGKTFATYELARLMGARRVLILTSKPAVEDAWAEDIRRHANYKGWRFVGNGQEILDPDVDAPVVCLASVQGLMGRNEDGEMRERFDAVLRTDWDLIVVDEYHYGAWRENARDLYESADEVDAETGDVLNQVRIRGQHYLYLSGTPFRAIATGEFLEDQIFNWSYEDEQRAKAQWTGPGQNPYAALPEMSIYAYRPDDEVRAVATLENNEFSLNELFRAEIRDGVAAFVHPRAVQSWLDMQRGKVGTYADAVHDKTKPPLPLEDVNMRNAMSHMLWYMPSVASCQAMADLLAQPANRTAYGAYEIVVAAGTAAGIGTQALVPVRLAMGEDPLKTRTITLSCGKLMTGVSVPPWGGIFMLRSIESPEAYFQAIFRVQTPHVTKGVHGDTIHKKTAYVFDYDPDRALKLIASYQMELCGKSKNGGRIEDEVGRFLEFMPVHFYDGATMERIRANDLLDIAVAGEGAAMIAKRWQSARLVDLSGSTLQRLMGNATLMAALDNIEAFRGLNRDLTKIIESERVAKEAKADKRDLTTEEKSDKADALKIRAKIQENLIKFATRIPYFMYLTDEREESVIEVIRNVSPDLFREVTGITVDDFNQLCDLGVFNRDVMNIAIITFRRIEDASLSYAGGETDGSMMGLWDQSVPKAALQ